MAILTRQWSKIGPTPFLPFLSMVLFTAVISGLMPSVVTAEPTTAAMTTAMTTAMNANEPLVFNASPNGGFEGQGRPASRSSGGSRGNCQTLLIALVPGEDSLSDDCSQPTYSSTALTTDAMPTLWFYLPEQDSTRQAELALLDDNRQAIALETLSLPATPGLVGIPLGYDLEVNQSYRWLFSISPDANPSRILTVEGIVRRVTPDAELLQSLEESPIERDRILSLAQAGVWHDALTELVMLRRQHPEDMTVIADWQAFLGSVGLDVIADVPIQECVGEQSPLSHSIFCSSQ